MVLMLEAWEALNSLFVVWMNLSLLAYTRSWLLAQVALYGPSTNVYPPNKQICIGVPLTCVCVASAMSMTSLSVKTHVIISMHSHFRRHTLIHHHRSMTIGLNIDVPVTAEKEQTRSHDSIYSKEILR